MLRSLTIGGRLTAAFSVLLALMLVTAGVTVWLSSKVNANVADLSGNWMPSIKALGEIQFYANNARRTELRVILEDAPQGKAEQRAQHQENLVKVEKELAEYEQLIASDEERSLYRQILKAWTEFRKSDEVLMGLAAQEERFSEARALANGSTASSFAAFLRYLQSDVDLNVTGGVHAANDAKSSYSRLVVSSAAVTVAAMVVGLLLAYYVKRSVTAPLKSAVAVAEAVAVGDLSSRTDDESPDEAGQLVRALGDMQSKLTAVVSSVRETSESIASGTQQIATGNADLSTRTEVQASNLQQSAAAIEEMAATVRQSAETATTVQELSQSACGAAEEGGRLVGQAVSTMDEIARGSAQISEIIGIIDGIAFQTNILALNAAVEAARAGEQGRGFAVVASEVRALAKRSAESAREIKTLINKSVETVGQGTRLVNEAGSSMSVIIDGARRVSQLIAEMTDASKQQAAGIEQVNRSVSELDRMTQQNAALVEEAAAASDSLRSQTKSLTETVAFFKV